MSNVNVIQWTPKKEGSGCFVTKVPQNSPGAANFKGTLPSGKTYDYWAAVVGKISGTLVWVDNKFNGEFGTKFLICLKSETGLIHIIETPYKVEFVKSFLNKLANTDKTKQMSVGYFVYEKTDSDGKPILSKTTKQPIREGTFTINQGGKNIPKFYNEDNPMPESTKWVKVIFKGEERWDDTPESS